MATYQYKYFIVTFPQEWVAHVETNRPEKLNAFIEAMWLELRVVFESLSTDPAVRVIVFSGAGERAFSAGLDVQAASAEGSMFRPRSSELQDGARRAAAIRRYAAEFQECVSSIEKCEKPVICVMHGFSIGISIDISTCADVRICASDAKFSVKEVDIGLAADVGTLTRLPKVVGSFSWVKEVCLSARIFGAEEALRVGFVSSVHPNKKAAIEEAMKIATTMAEKSPVAVQGTKEFLNYCRDNTVENGLRYTAVWNSAALQTGDVATAMVAGIKKQKPVFPKL